MGWKKQLTGVAVVASLSVTGGTALAQSAAAGSQHGQSAVGAQESGAQASRPAADDTKKFYKKAALGNMAEVELGKLGAEKAQNQEVKQFAQSMAEAHQRALDELKQVASGNIEWPTALDEKRQKVRDELSALNGEEFDREFMDAIVDAHESIEDLLEDYVGANRAAMDPSTATGTASSGAGAAGTSGSATGTSGSDRPAAAASPRLSGAAYDWAAKSLQEVRSHIEQAKDLRDQVKK